MSKQTTADTKPKHGRNAALAAVALLVVVGVTVAWMNPFSGGHDLTALPTFEVERGELVISVTESGTIEARDQVILESEVEGHNTLIHLVDEGAEVKEGDLLAELDASQLEEQRVSQQISVQNAEANLIGAQTNKEITESQGQSDVDVARLAHEFAKQDLANYRNGEYPKEEKEFKSRIALAQSELTQARDRLEGSGKLLAEQYISQNEYDGDALAVARRQLDVELAEQNLELLQGYTRPRREAELESDVEQTRAALDRTTRRAQADLVQAEAQLRARQQEYDRQRDRLVKVEDQIEKCRIFAPRGGMVVYATSVQGGRRGNREPLEAGQSIRERQELIYLPRSGSMRVEVKVHESSLDKVRVGQKVRVSVDTMPNRTYEGRVTRIAPLPDAQSIWLNPDLTVYATTIVLDDTGQELRTGMTCRAQIIVEEYDDAVYVPVQSVVRVGALPVVYVPTRAGLEARPVELGLDNNRMVRLVNGVEPGDRVLLAPPLTADSETLARLAPLQPTPTEAENLDAADADAPGEAATAAAVVDEAPAAEADQAPQHADRQMTDEQRQHQQQETP